MSIAGKVAKMQSRGSAGVPPPPPAFIEFKRRLAKKEREAKLAVEKERATAAEREKAATAEAKAREIAQAKLAKERAAAAEREKTKATQAPKRTSMSIADKMSHIQGRGSAGAPPPQPVEPSGGSHFIEFKRRLAKKGGGIAERITKLQAGAGDGAAAPPGSPPSTSDRSGSGTAPRRVTVADGAKGTGGGIAARTQKLGGEEGIVLPGAFEVPTPPAAACESARTSLRSERKPAILPPQSAQTRPPRTRALDHAARSTPPHCHESCSASASSRSLLLFPVSFSSVLLRFSRCWRRDKASARGAVEPHNVDERRWRPITGRRRRHR